MPRKPPRSRNSSSDVDPRDSARRHNVDLAEIDIWMRRAYDRIKNELDEVDAQLEALAETRALLANRAAQLELGLGIHDDDDVSPRFEPPVEPPRRRVPSPPPRNHRPPKKHGALWQDVSASIQGKGPMQASEIIQRLVASGYEDNDNLRTRVYNSLGRWAREGKLSKRSRGMYELKGD